MSDRTNLVYLYDGSFDGLLCCVFESYTHREAPVDICPIDAEQGLLYETRLIETDNQHAGRVYLSIQNRLGKDAEHLIKTAFLFGLEGKELALFRLICLGYRYGRQVCDMLGNPIVSQVHNMAKAVSNENHLLLGFLRFSEYGGSLVGVIEPKHFVLPLMQGHFCARYPEEQFMIYDKTHGAAIIYRPYEAKLISVESLELPQEDEVEQQYRRLWAQYFKTIAIPERINPRCQMGHMPKRFWTHLTEKDERNQSRLSSEKTQELIR